MRGKCERSNKTEKSEVSGRSEMRKKRGLI